MAKTWNWRSAMRRTQQATFAVSPSSKAGGGRAEAGESGLADREVVDAAESDPGARGVVLLTHRRTKQVADQRHGEDKADGRVQH
jgi:hypothetical protein